ncbi:MAG: hypothetical protein ACO4CU_11825, partial [Ilumatobacteraceae bacterium]
MLMQAIEECALPATGSGVGILIPAVAVLVAGGAALDIARRAGGLFVLVVAVAAMVMLGSVPAP